MTRLCWPLRLLAALLLLPALLAAQQHPNKESGFNPETLFNLGEIDAINNFNGSLQIVLPIGQRYPVGGSLDYGLTLVYSSNVWESEERATHLGDYEKAIPNRSSNAGLGWQVSFGRMLTEDSTSNTSNRPVYVASDGSEHRFATVLHGSDPLTPDLEYTRDGTYLRRDLRNGQDWVEIGNGERRRFDLAGRVVRMEDRFGNWVSIAYSTVNGLKRWTISDPHGRVHRLDFDPGIVGAPADGVLIQADLAAFGGRRAVYQFHYESRLLQEGCTTPNPVRDHAQIQDPYTVTVPLLTRIELPPDPSVPGELVFDIGADAYNLGSGPTCDTHSGVLRGMTLPNLGRLEWDYQTYVFPTYLQCGPMSASLSRSTGVSERRTIRKNGSVEGRWTYQTQLEFTPGACHNFNQPKELINTVIDALGHKTVTYYSVAQVSNQPPWNPEEYALPLTHAQPGDGAGRFLSQQIFSSSGQLLRSKYVRYEWDGYAPGGVALFRQNNQREASSRTVYHDDGNRYTQMDSTDFDGLGHYRQVTTSGNFAGGSARTTVTDFNPGLGTYPHRGIGSTHTGWPASRNWVLGTFASVTTTEGSDSERVQTCFDEATGFLKRRRRMVGMLPGASDVIEHYQADGAGNLDWEASYGGDVQAVSTSTSLCTLPLPADQYRTEHTFQYGALRSSLVTGVLGPLYTVDQDLDRNTALPARQRDPSGIYRDLFYDELGRLEWVQPQAGHGARTEYTYFPAVDVSKARVKILQKQGGTTLTTSWIVFDAFGRIYREERLMPANTAVDSSGQPYFNRRQTRYNQAGLRKSVTEVGQAGTTIPETKFLYHDPFGRVGQIEPPDGSQHAISFAYKGVRETTRTVNVGTSWNGSSVTETPSSTTEIYDPHGRLYQVLEPSGSGGSLQTTTYTYDVGNRLSFVNMGGQTRQFIYDGRGFLTAERHPEKGVGGNGWVSYLGYDARGHATRKIDGANDLTYRYDRAERLFRVEETGGPPLKEWAFGNSVGFDRNRGKVVQATRHNYVSIPLTNTLSTDVNIRVLETYQYSGVGGRVSSKNTLMDTGPPAAGWAQSWVYDPLGNVTSQKYPECILDPCSLLGEDSCTNHCNATAGGSPTQTYAYSEGLLKSVPGRATSISYHPNGLVHQVAHANGVTETQENDPWQMSRPRQISTSGGNRNWSSGIYKYDGAGNIKEMGADWFTYDKVSRIQHASLEDAPFQGGTVRQQRYTYDRWGNILTIDTKHGAGAWELRTTPTSSSTNRLTGAGYDASGNMTFWGGYTYVYDAFDMLTEMDGGGNRNRYIYTADDERLWVVDFDPVNGGPESDDYFTLRDLDGSALREYNVHGGNGQAGNWSLVEDRFYRSGSLLASKTGLNQDAHYHLDHLGSPRLVTGDPQVDGAFLLGRHNYFPFGEEATVATQNGLRMKFTGHERDFNEGGGQGTLDDLDYMHARYCNPRLGRFLSVDPADTSVQRPAPQTWNRYSYVANRALVFNDPDGERQNPVTRQRGVSPPQAGKVGAIRSNASNPRVGQFGLTRKDSGGNPKRHNGIDINAPQGTPLVAAEGGTITRMSNGKQAGNRLDIETAGGETLIYAHLDSFSPGLSVGDSVQEGEVVGEAGTTGNAQGIAKKEEHVHFAVLDQNGQRLDPEAWLNDPQAPAPQTPTQTSKQPPPP